MLEAIYSCKMYKNSKNKSKINAAIQNPVNQELVKQLSKYIDDVKYKDTEDDLSKVSTIPNSTHSDSNHDASVEDTKVDKSESAKSKFTHVSNRQVREFVPSQPSDTSENSIDTEEVEPSEVNDVKDEPFEEVESNTDINDFKQMLNDTDNISGVNRTQKKNNEFWIYYNDNINLNNIMGDVIEFCCSRDSNLQFNRLARSENALVFETVDNIL